MNHDTRAANAWRLVEAKRTDEAWDIVAAILCENPDHIGALAVAAKIHERKSGPGIAYQFYKRLADIAPNESASWVNFGRVSQDLWRTDEAKGAYAQGFSVATRGDSIAALSGNMAALHIDHGEFDKAEEHALKALGLNPESKCAKINLGFCQLANHDWKAGWKNYHHSIGIDWRPKVQYRDEPEWEGEHGKKLILYGDQGIGDEICFASMVNEAKNISRKLVLDVDNRLAGLYRRSFPDVVVYGTRMGGEKWSKADRDFECSLPISQAGEFLRLSDDNFHSDTYLKADPERVLMWKALFAQKRKPAIGIAWSGGIHKTGAKWRKLTLEMLKPLLSSIDAHWVSLQYKHASNEIADFRLFNEGIDIKEYPHATLTQDYDDTAALVAACDLVVSVPTAVVHLAGALGTPCITMKSPKPCWKFYKGLIWHPHIRLVEHTDWPDTIERTALEVCRHFGTEKREPDELTTVFTVKGTGNGVGLNA